MQEQDQKNSTTTTYGTLLLAEAEKPSRANIHDHYFFDILLKNNKIYLQITCNPNKQNSYRWYVHAIAAPFVLIKFFASAGLRLYSLIDFFYNQDYLLYPAVGKIPTFISAPLIIYGMSGDGHMNAVTRAPSTYEMIANWWRDKESVVLVESRARKTAKGFVKFCGIVDTFGASLGTFLGILTLLKYVTEDKPTLLSWGIVVFISNFVTNFAYRIRKAGNNLMDLLDGKLRWPNFSESLIIIFATLAFLGTCDYGTSHSIRNFLDLINIYHGDPDTHVGQEDKYEKLIYGITNSTMGFSAISFLLSQCAQMLTTPPLRPAKDDGRTLVIWARELRRNYYHTLKQQNINLCCGPWYVWLPLLVRASGIWFGRLSVPGEMLGNGLLVLNGCIGLIVRLITNNPYIVVPSALLLAFVSSIIYWHFNIPDWLANPKKMYISSVLYALKKIGIWMPEESAYIDQLRQTLITRPKSVSDSPAFSMPLNAYRLTVFSKQNSSSDNSYFHRLNEIADPEDIQGKWCAPHW